MRWVVVIAETERLVLQRCTEDDAQEMAAIGTPEVVRYLGGMPWTEATALESIRVWRDIERRLGVTTWAARSRSTGELVGTCGFAGTNVPWLRRDMVIEIGWTLARRFWGQGLATEAARAALSRGVEVHDATRIISKCHVANAASERVMHRIGMRRAGVVQGAWTAPTVVYRLA